MPKKKTNYVWRVTQPPLNEDIVVFANYAKPSYHFVKWCPNGPDWDIKLGHGMYVGPRNFEGGYQFLPDIKSKEFLWMPRKEFLNKVKNGSNKSRNS